MWVARNRRGGVTIRGRSWTDVGDVPPSPRAEILVPSVLLRRSSAEENLALPSDSSLLVGVYLIFLVRVPWSLEATAGWRPSHRPLLIPRRGRRRTPRAPRPLTRTGRQPCRSVRLQNSCPFSGILLSTFEICVSNPRCPLCNAGVLRGWTRCSWDYSPSLLPLPSLPPCVCLGNPGQAFTSLPSSLSLPSSSALSLVGCLSAADFRDSSSAWFHVPSRRPGRSSSCANGNFPSRWCAISHALSFNYHEFNPTLTKFKEIFFFCKFSQRRPSIFRS